MTKAGQVEWVRKMVSGWQAGASKKGIHDQTPAKCHHPGIQKCESMVVRSCWLREARNSSGYTWNLEKWYWWADVQGRKRDSDLENGFLDVSRGEGGMNWGGGIDVYALCTRVSSATRSCQLFCDPTDCSLPVSSVHGIFKARILEWVAISYSTCIHYHM